MSAPTATDPTAAAIQELGKQLLQMKKDQATSNRQMWASLALAMAHGLETWAHEMLAAGGNQLNADALQYHEEADEEEEDEEEEDEEESPEGGEKEKPKKEKKEEKETKKAQDTKDAKDTADAVHKQGPEEAEAEAEAEEEEDEDEDEDEDEEADEEEQEAPKTETKSQTQQKEKSATTATSSPMGKESGKSQAKDSTKELPPKEPKGKSVKGH